MPPAHSADGLHWELDGLHARWPEGDVILAAYHPAQRRGIVSYKRNPRYHEIQRRAVWIASLVNGQWDDGGRALTPDEFGTRKRPENGTGPINRDPKTGRPENGTGPINSGR